VLVFDDLSFVIDPSGVKPPTGHSSLSNPRSGSIDDAAQSSKRAEKLAGSCLVLPSECWSRDKIMQ
jgi:hypothetical protein